MPPKSLFDNSHRPDKLVMPACGECNRNTSTADLTAAVVSRWGEAHSNESDHRRHVIRLRKQAPLLVEEWTASLGFAQSLRGRQHLAKHGVHLPPGTPVITIGPETIRQLNLFAHKVTLALYFEHFRRPLSTQGAFSAYWRTKEDVIANDIPQKLFTLFPKLNALRQGTWDTSQIFAYRHDLNLSDDLFGFIARLRGGLYVTGFTVGDARLVEGDTGWRQPGDLLLALEEPDFHRRQ